MINGEERPSCTDPSYSLQYSAGRLLSSQQHTLRMDCVSPSERCLVSQSLPGVHR